MIIKSMSRKEPTFDQLLGYMNREASSDRYSLRHNCYARGERELEAEFTRNASRMRRRSNGVFMYHEILSITKDGDLSDHERKDILRQVAQKYIEMRCPDNMAYGVVHDDHPHHLHYHLLISSNEVSSSKRTRLSKADFQSLKVEMERRVLSDYPTLRQKVSIDKLNDGERVSQRGEELKRRTGELPERTRVKETIAEIFADSLDRDELFTRLRAQNMDLYVRGKSIGIIDGSTGRKYRLNRLGLQERFAVLSARMEQLARIERETATDSQTQTNAVNERENNMINLSAKVVGASQKLQEGASSLVEKGKKAFEGVIDQFTPTDEVAKARRLTQEGEGQTEPQAQPSEEREAAYRARMREMDEIRAADKQDESQQKTGKK
jgi:hypothetical protein